MLISIPIAQCGYIRPTCSNTHVGGSCIMELEIFLFWFVFTCLMWVATKIHYAFSDTCLNWKYFKEDYSAVGAIHCVSLYLGYIGLPIYLFVKAAQWWFA
jgi:hypothetical protein